jgi:hypothetical protein
MPQRSPAQPRDGLADALRGSLGGVRNAGSISCSSGGRKRLRRQSISRVAPRLRGA